MKTQGTGAFVIALRTTTTVPVCYALETFHLRDLPMMSYFLNLFSPETWNAFQLAGSRISGFSRHQRTQAERTIDQGDIFLCYLVGLGRWCGALKIESGFFIDETPLFKPEP